MYIISREFFRDFVNNPGDVLLTLRRRKSHISLHIVRFLLFWRIVFSEYGLNRCITRSCAMAYALLLTLIPLVATAAFMVAGLIEVQPEEVKQFFKVLLPFAPDTLLDYIAIFFVNARQLRGVGIVVLIIVAVGLFGVVEESFNTIWKVTRARSFFIRMRTFTMVMVYSPLLFLLSLYARRSPWFDLVSSRFLLLDAVPFLLMVLGFSSLIAFVPNTKVGFSPAFVGGLVAAVLFEVERRFFGMFVLMSIHTQKMYGAVGILPLFLISLFLAALITLFGAQMGYVLRNFRPLLRAKKRWDRRVGDYKTYITFRMLLDCIEAFYRKRNPHEVFYFCVKYELSDVQALGILNWLVHEGFLHPVGGRKNGYIPTRDFMQTPIKEVIDAIENQSRRIPASPDDVGRGIIADIIGNLALSGGGRIREMTFAQLIERLETASDKRRGNPSTGKRGAAPASHQTNPAVTE
jgi:membrane protein